MKFKEGDKVEFIYMSKLKQGVVSEIKEGDFSANCRVKGEFTETLWYDENDLISSNKLLKVPRFVDDWISRCKQKGYDLFLSIDYDDSDMPYEMYNWLTFSDENQEILARAWLDGYEVEKEPLYYVRLPLSTWNDDAAELEVINMYVLLNKQSDETTFTGLIINKNKKWTTKLTEAEIKGMPGGDIYWQFAVLVEELEE
ncbi:TPA: DUF1642 domain-containing protein [Listeria monocytogenes]|uniref:DUF1642 domain-containing protein n=1 Tax=Listeria monocytogenes TaxID=1639 RepID=UPI00244664E9|nr:DUF1642 domain-containing protein [Listeria monocytogenes]HEN3927223.1 DUF1642 domain-containing protein [Listeria monocytogenes]HEN3936556.1 DUF1642 domain-containing protein [Listeria monocytogenes]HEN3957315.1 DUF1642 domain-containing protein [Listeria monocytogenes]